MDEDQTTSPAPSAPPPQTAPVTASVAAPVTASAAPSSLDELQQSIRALFPNGAAAEPASTGSAQRFPAGSIQDTIVQAAQQHGVSPALMLALGESESSFNPNAVSPTGPRGLFQFTRKTAAAYGVDPDDPVSSARGAAAYMNDLLKQTGGDTEAALKLYKGFAQGGATQKHINHTLGLVTKYGGASISDPSVPQVHSAPGQGTQTTQGTEGTPPRDPTDTQTPIGATPDLQSTIASRQPAPPSPEDSANPELQAALRAQFAPAAEEPKTDDVHDIASLSKLISNLGYQGKLNTGPNAYPRMPKLTEPKGPYADRGPLEPAGEWVNRIDTGIANSSPLAALQGVIQSLPGEAVPLRAVGEALNTALGDVPQALLPKTFEKLEEATTSGNPAVDWLVNTGSQGLGFVGSMMVGGAALEATGLPIEGVAKTATLMGLRAAPADAIQVAMGEKNPISALVDVAVVQPTVGALFHGASTIANTPTRIAASGAASGVGYVAGQAVAGEPVTLAGAGEAVGVGGIYGVAGGGHGGGDAEDAAVKKADVDVKAHEAATSPTNDRPAPTPAQQDAGNYKKGHVAIQGLDISIENPQGSIRSGVDHNGEPWSTTMQDHYGYIRGTSGVDGDHIDAFIGPDPTSEKVFVVDQLAKPATETEPSVLDEHKVILGAHTRDEAEQIYRRNYSDDATQRIGAITEASMPKFKDWLANGDAKQPFNENMRADERSSEPASPPVPETKPDNVNTEQSTTEAGAETSAPGLADTGRAGTRASTRGGERETASEGPREEAPSRNPRPAEALLENDDALPTEPAAGTNAGSDRAQRPGISEGVRANGEDRQGNAEGPGARGDNRELASGGGGLRPEGVAPDEGPVTREPITLHDTGRETKLRTGDTKMPVKYALVESKDIQLSHDEQTFAENPNYAGENQNRYDKDLAQQAAVIEGGADLDFDILHSTTSSSTEGPTVVDRFGQAAGGNGRGMMQKRAYDAKPEETKMAVVADAAKFGLDPRKAAEMERPTIVRVQAEDVNRSVESRRNVSAQNQTATKQRTPAVDGVDLSKRLTPENKHMLSEGLADVRSLADLTESAEKAKPIIRVLRDAGQITKANQNEYITPEATLTPKGRETVEGMTMGLIVPDAELIGKLPDNFRQKLGENLRTLGSIEATPGWELHDNLARVTDYIEARRAFIERGGVKSTFDTQGSLLSDADRPPALTSEDRLLLNLLEDPKRTKFKSFMQSYAAAAADARAGETDLAGEVMTRDRAFREAEEAAGMPPRTGLGAYFDATKEADESAIRKSLGGSSAVMERPRLIDERPAFITGSREEIERLQARDHALERVERRNAAKEPFVPAEQRLRRTPRGAQAIVDRLGLERRFKKTGDPTTERAIGDFMARIGEDLFSDVGLSIRRRGGAQGQFDFANKLVTLFTKTAEEASLNQLGGFGAGSPLRTLTHELWHSLARYVPGEDVEALRKQYQFERSGFLAKNEWAYDLVNRSKFTREAAEEWRTKYPEKAYHVDPDGTINHSSATYRYTHFDEWWAETMADKSLPKGVAPKSVVGRVIDYAKGILRSMAESVQRAFGYNRSSKIFNDFVNGKMGEKFRDAPFGDPTSGRYAFSDIRLDEAKLDDEKVEAAGEARAPLDPAIVPRLARRGAAFIYDGAKDLTSYSAKMIDEFGERVRDDLAALYVHSKALVLVNAGEGMRGTVRELSEAYHKTPDNTDFKRIAGDYTGSVQMLDHDLINYAKELKAAVPDIERREAIGNYIQAGGDEKLLLERAAKSAPKYQRGYEAAARLTPEEKAIAEASRARQEQNGRDAVDAGLMESLVDNYLHGEYVKNPDAAGKLANMAASGYFDANPSALRAKIYDTYFDAEQAGLTPKDKDFARLIIGNERALKVAELAREAVHSMLKSKEKDGLPTVIVGGAGHLVESDEKTAPFLVQPNATMGTDMSKYKYFDHPALRKWKWIGTDSGGKPVLMQGDMWIHKDAYGKMTGLLGRSKIRNYTIPQSVPVIGGRRPVKAALEAAQFVKGTIMLGPFHQFNVGQHAVYHAVNPYRPPEIDFEKRPLLAEGVTHGLMLVTHGPEGEFGDMMASGALHYVPVVGDGLKRYQAYLFQEYIPRLKALTFEKAFVRAETRYAGDLASGKLSRDQLLDIVANQSNAMYGELNSRYPGGSVLHDPTVRDVARLAFLAPDFLEARMKSLGQAARPYGHEQRMALLRGALVMGATAQIANLLIGDDHKTHWDRPFSVIVGGREYSARSEVADLAHLIADPRGFWYHRLNPLWGRPLLEMAEGRDMNGDKVGIGQAAQDILKSWVPIPAQGFFKNNLGGTATQSVVSALLGSAGVSSFMYRTDGERFIADRAHAKWSPEKPSADAMELFAGKSELRDAFRRNAPSAEIAQIKSKYGITNKQASRAMHDARQPPLVLKAERLTAQELADAFEHHLNAEERQELAPLFARKLNAANDKFEMPEEEKNFYRTKYGLTVAAAHAPLAGTPLMSAPAYGMPVQ